MRLAEVEQRLEKLKAECGKDDYVRAINAEDCDLPCDEVWVSTANLREKHDGDRQA